jgi:ATP/maltotriose-dependent transcriptional regulator MalT
VAWKGELRVEARLVSYSIVTLRGTTPGLMGEGRAIDGLAPRERQVLALVARGLSNAQVADRIGVASATVKKHLENIYEKLGVSSRTAAALAYQRDTIPTDRNSPGARDQARNAIDPDLEGSAAVR